MVRMLLPLIVGALIISGALSCASDDAGVRKKKPASTKTATQSNKKPKSPSEEPAGDPQATDPDIETETCPDGALLQDASAFEAANIVIANECAFCHNSATYPGGNYSLPATLKDQAALIKERINLPEGDPKLMPPGQKMSSGKIGALVHWVDAGAPLPAGTDPGDPDAQEQDACVTGGAGAKPTSTKTEASIGTTTPGDPIPEAWKPYVEPEAKKLCHDQDKPFYREPSPEHPYGSCFDTASYPAPFQCTYEGVLAAFNNNPSVKSELDQYKANGYTYDDCGVLNGKPIVFFVCFTNGDTTCRNIKDLSIDRLRVLYSYLAPAP